VFPFNKFRGVDTILGPRLRSTGEVMGFRHRTTSGSTKAQLAAGQRLPRKVRFPQRERPADKKHLEFLKRAFFVGFHLLPPGNRGCAGIRRIEPKRYSK